MLKLRSYMYAPALGRRCFLYLSQQAKAQCQAQRIHISNNEANEQQNGVGVNYNLNLNDDNLEVNIHSHKMEFNNIWLRDHCRCSSCLNESNMQRKMDPANIDPNISPDKVSLSDDNCQLDIKWPDGHASSYLVDWLTKAYKQSTQRQEDNQRVFWDREILESSLPPDVTFEEYMESEEGVARLLRNLHKFGVAFMSGVPITGTMTRLIGERVSPLKRPINGEIVYSAELGKILDDHSYRYGNLPFHTDFASHYDPPGYVQLHYLEQAEVGGESVFSDSLRAARLLRESYPDHYEALSTLPVAFHKLEKDKGFVQCVSTVFDVREPNQDPVIIRTANDDRSLLALPAPDAKRWYAAWRKFREITTDPKNIYAVKCMPGRVIVLDNWRLEHGRLDYEGTRSFHACFWSRDRIFNLMHKFGIVDKKML